MTLRVVAQSKLVIGGLVLSALVLKGAFFLTEVSASTRVRGPGADVWFADGRAARSVSVECGDPVSASGARLGAPALRGLVQ